MKIGCCGYPVSKGKYYQNFQLVEINSTFYQYPKLNTLSRWRTEAPTGFEFTLKTHQDISHVNKLKLTADCLNSVDRIIEFCKTLNAKILLIQTPPSFIPNKENLKTAASFFRKNSGRKEIIWV